jgi:hypothetical protein
VSIRAKVAFTFPFVILCSCVVLASAMFPPEVVKHPRAWSALLFLADLQLGVYWAMWCCVPTDASVKDRDGQR